ncbi:MAG: hypothetical protein RIF33_07360 [Cyclobacteriaceae bacterium]
MKFSTEEIYFQFGQFDRFVTLSFKFNSRSSKSFGRELMGIFKYTLDERRELEEKINQDIISRTNGFVKFIPSELEELTDEQKIGFDKIGVECKDISSILFLNLGNKNKNNFIEKQKREISNTIDVEINSANLDLDRYRLWFYNNRLRSEYDLSPKEKTEYYGMLQLYDPKLSSELKQKLTDVDQRYVELPDQYYYLRSKSKRQILSQEEIEKFEEYKKQLYEKRMKVVLMELKKSNERMATIHEYKGNIQALIEESVNFENDLILPFKLPIWWDFERFVHIYARHVEETKIGNRFENKTSFSYTFENIKSLINTVCQKVYPQAIKHFETNNSNFRRMGDRSIYFEGVYYRIEIERTGRLIAFHPYNG